jgi:hypothetical protein
LSFSASPFGTVTNRSEPTPTFTWRAAPFHTSICFTGVAAL